jgi:hypothetical protein
VGEKKKVIVSERRKKKTPRPKKEKAKKTSQLHASLPLPPSRVLIIPNRPGGVVDPSWQGMQP